MLEISNFYLSKAPILWGFFFPDCGLAKRSRPVTYVTGSSPLFEILCKGECLLDAKMAPAKGIMVRELTTGVLAAMGWLVVATMLTLIAAFIASALA
jgi:hypothetical protein